MVPELVKVVSVPELVKVVSVPELVIASMLPVLVMTVLVPALSIPPLTTPPNVKVLLAELVSLLIAYAPVPLVVILPFTVKVLELDAIEWIPCA